MQTIALCIKLAQSHTDIVNRYFDKADIATAAIKAFSVDTVIFRDIDPNVPLNEISSEYIIFNKDKKDIPLLAAIIIDADKRYKNDVVNLILGLRRSITDAISANDFAEIPSSGLFNLLPMPVYVNKSLLDMIMSTTPVYDLVYKDTHIFSDYTMPLYTSRGDPSQIKWVTELNSGFAINGTKMGGEIFIFVFKNPYHEKFSPIESEAPIYYNTPSGSTVKVGETIVTDYNIIFVRLAPEWIENFGINISTKVVYIRSNELYIDAYLTVREIKKETETLFEGAKDDDDKAAEENDGKAVKDDTSKMDISAESLQVPRTILESFLNKLSDDIKFIIKELYDEYCKDEEDK